MKTSFSNIFVVLLWLAVFGVDGQTVVEAPMKDVNQVVDLTLDSLNVARTARPVSGSTRKGDNPVLFLVGNSTMRTGTLGNGNNGQWGWGYFAHEYFDNNKITVENHALGGTSSRTFYNKLWPDVLKGVQPGDWVIIELGHNDNGPYDSGRARASIPGIGKDSIRVTIKETGVVETVYSYGEYMRRFVAETKSKGAYPVLMSLTPRNAWQDTDSTVVTRVDKTFGLWARQIADECNVPFIDLNDITALKYEKFGKEKVKYMFYGDRIHTSRFGAKVNAGSAAEGIRNCEGLKLADYLKEVVDDIAIADRKEGGPVLFTIGDSTVKNEDKDTTSMWGWGSVIGDLFVDSITTVNCAMAGRSARTFLNEGRWDKVYNALRPGDYVLIQFGHNDGGDINTGKARGELKGSGAESKVFKMESDGSYEVVYTFGWYIRKFVMDVKEKGAIPIVLSHTPRNKWTNGRVERNNLSYGLWSKEAAMESGAYFIDLNAISADKLEMAGEQRAGIYFKKDHTHTSLNGAIMNALSIVEGLKKSDCLLKNYIR
jgi:lysophospholipase L1-like esterase